MGIVAGAISLNLSLDNSGEILLMLSLAGDSSLCFPCSMARVKSMSAVRAVNEENPLDLFAAARMPIKTMLSQQFELLS